MAIKPLDSKVGGTIIILRIQTDLEKNQRLMRSMFLRPFADALNGDPQQTSCEECVVRLLSLTMCSAIEIPRLQSH